ncbi:MAG: hypothetical protein DME13_19185 [Candidatus Rokuibacteriota bacterium]|nr:MAG: hypothetical protein DME13_19185 [Candidatus Rokubacteria bacterium]
MLAKRAMLSLYITSRAEGRRWALRDDDAVDVWNADGSRLVFVIAGAVMRALVQHHLDGLARQADTPERARPARRQSRRAAGPSGPSGGGT